jgi:hypothetical protein
MAQVRRAYHSFPRRGAKTVAAANRKGIAVLRSIAAGGLLLRPEVLTIPGEVLADGTTGKDSFIAERYASFTVRTETELVAEHADTFGEFSIEFELAKLVELGALPVFYLPLRRDQNSPARSLTATTAELSRLLERLQGWGQTAKSPKAKMLFTVSGRRALEVDRQVVKQLLELMTQELRPISALLADLQALTTLIYPVDAGDAEALRYFEQREWRLVSGLIDPAVHDAAPPSPQEKAVLLAIDRSFYSKVIELRSYSAPRIDECLLVRRVRGRRFLELARRVLVPRGAFEQARAAVADFPALAVESLDA